ncbi:hypothetical protein [Nocardia testacea]|uniref:hypothetical protein n=1 Tax=Nocardia testacea TaxID=248551 RepID=UPI00340C982A
MRPELPPLPNRQPAGPAMVATLNHWQAGKSWVTDDPAILRRLAEELRGLPDDRPTNDCRSCDPVRGRAHAHQLMAAHAGHDCPRYTTAAQYTTGIRA